MFAGRHCGHHELEVGGAGSLQHQNHEDSLTGRAGPVLLAVKTAPNNISLMLPGQGQDWTGLRVNILEK